MYKGVNLGIDNFFAPKQEFITRAFKFKDLERSKKIGFRSNCIATIGIFGDYDVDGLRLRLLYQNI